MSKHRLCLTQPGTTAQAAYAGGTTVTTIDAASVANTSADAATLDVHIVPQGGSATNGNALYKALSVPAGTSLSLGLLVNHAILANETLHLRAGTAGALTVAVSGRRA